MQRVFSQVGEVASEDARLVSADLQEAKLQGTQLIGTNMEGALKRFTNFNDAYMKDCTGCPLDW